jgi:hypothetical protein
MMVIQRVVKTAAQIAQDANNNHRAKWFLIATLALWLISSFVIIPTWGFGKPLINRQEISLLPHSSSTLSEQQIFYNSLPGVKGSDDEIKSPAPKQSTTATGKWQKPAYSLILLWSVFSIIYAILSMREEVAEAFRRGVDEVIDRRYATVSARDPFFQRLLAYSGHLKAIRRPEVMDITPTTVAAVNTTSGTSTPVIVAKNTFWERLESSLVSDTVVEIVPEILKAILHWLKR